MNTENQNECTKPEGQAVNVEPLVVRININGIDLEKPENEPPWYLKTKGWECHIFYVAGPKGVNRDDLNKMIGGEIYGKKIRAVESYAINNQYGKKISLAIDAYCKSTKRK